jgi:uncharacterized UPF0160 family protein
MVIATHDGGFHADEVFALAALTILYPEATIVRTRDPAQLAQADIVVDVGGEYDPARLRFDHHQRGGAGARDNGIPYAAFGLVWKHFGEQIAGSLEVAKWIDRTFVSGIDAQDVGVALCAPHASGVTPTVPDDLADLFCLAWDEEGDQEAQFKAFFAFAQQCLMRVIQHAQSTERARIVVEAAYRSAEDKRIIELPVYCAWKDAIVEYPEPLFVLFPDRSNVEVICMQAVPSGEDVFAIRARFPEKWRGRSGESLEQESGVVGARFCHLVGFFATAGSWESARQMVRLALVA